MSWRRRFRAAILTAGSLTVLGCETRDDRFDEALNLTEPAVVEGAVVVGSPARLGVFLLRNDSTISFLPVGARLETPVSRPAHSGFVAFESGREAVWSVATDTGRSTRFALAGRFDLITLNSSGSRAVLTRSPQQGGLVNTSEVAFLALDEAPGAQNPVYRSLPSKGGAVLAVDIAPKYGDGGAELALIRSADHIAVVDLDVAAAGTIRSVPLAPDGAAGEVIPRESVFHAEETALHAFIRTASGSDVLHLRFGPPDGTGAPKPTLNQLSAGGRPDALIVLPAADEIPLQIATLVDGNRLVILEPETGQSRDWSLSERATQLVEFPGPTGTELLAWSPQNDAIQRIRLSELPTKKQKAITVARVQTEAGTVVPMADGAWYAVIPTQENDSADQHLSSGNGTVYSGVTLVEVDGPGLVPLLGQVTDVLVSADRERLIIATYDGQVTIAEARSGAVTQSDALGDFAALAVIPGSDTIVALPYDQSGTALFLNQKDIARAPTRYVGYGRLNVLSEVP